MCVVFFTAVTVTLEEHLFKFICIQDVNAFLVEVIFFACRTFLRVPPIDFNTGYTAILAAFVIIFTRIDRDALANEADQLLGYLLCR